MKLNSLPVAIATLLMCLFLFSSSSDNCEPSGGGTNPPPGLCNNSIKDVGEDGVDCGGVCDACFPVDIERELIIRNLNVVNSSAAQTGDLSFGNIMERLTSNGTTTKELVLSVLESWQRTDLDVNNFNILPRPGMNSGFVDVWKQRDHGSTVVTNNNWNMNLDNVPLRLLAITSRLDLADISQGKAGEGRLTFGIDNGSNVFTLIFEFNLAGSTQTDVVNWAKKWHSLSNINSSSPQYLTKVVEIVNEFTQSGADLSQLRTNEVMGDFSSGLWEFREFRIANTGLFEEVSRKQSPSTDLEGSSDLTLFINSNRPAIDDGTIVIPESSTALAGNARYTNSFTWSAPTIQSTDPALSTLNFISCVGCHGGFFPGTGFTHIKPRTQGSISNISPFLVQDLDNRRDNSINNLLELQFATPLVSSFRDSLNIISTSTTSDLEEEQIRRLLEKFANVKRVH